MADIIFDVDGTLMNITHRKHHVEKTPKDYVSFRAAMGDDVPNEDIVDMAKMLKAAGHRIIISSGRYEAERMITNHQLLHAGVQFDAMYLRKNGDHRKDAVVKKEMLAAMHEAGFDPTMAFDDRDSVVRMWRENGLRCFQVAAGAF